MYLYRFVHTYRRSCIHLQYVQYIYKNIIHTGIFGKAHAHHPAQAHMWEDNGRQWGPREGGRTIQHRHTYVARHWETMGDKGRKDLGEADAPSNKWKQEGRPWETRGDKALETRTHHPGNGKQDGKGPVCARDFFPPARGFFSPSRTHQFPRYLQHVKPRSCHFDNICSILELLLRFLQNFAARN